MVANDATIWRHMDRFVRRPLSILSVCWRRVNIPAAPVMAER